MIIKYNYSILLLMLSIGFSARPTFINIQTVNGIVSYPTIASVSETHVILMDGSEIKMENINSVSLWRRKVIFSLSYWSRLWIPWPFPGLSYCDFNFSNINDSRG